MRPSCRNRKNRLKSNKGVGALQLDTKLLKPTFPNLKFCAELLKSGEIVGVPTETVYGLAANAFDDGAVLKIFKAKGRPHDNPIICHVNGLEMFKSLTCERSQVLFNLIDRFWPGPLTVVVEASVANLSRFVLAGLSTVGVRFSSSKVLNELIGLCGFPLAAPSANLSKKPSSTNATHVVADFNGKIPAILEGGQCEIGVESTVVKVERNRCVILRPGFITVNMLKSVVKNVELSAGVVQELQQDDVVESPGLKHRHYSPKAEVVVVRSELSDFVSYVSSKLNEKVWCVVADEEADRFGNFVLTYGKNLAEQAKNLFFVLRRVDDLKIDKVFFRCSAEHESELGLAIYNRLIRAANFNIINFES